ncbi:CDP-alcohol phosphatidyltransferase family protein [Microbacterium betulae]|uniref:CDP-alcohol phosphatidyltransferase family protein n=1 Tax=Microbacterium betulae TaxID=2981139 RepID=A0AA97I6P7_9MICO|nr:CDP-alcohol phosphatidyltransferase family protein [Microbacterium sp. AB]WOF22635.1 CDP-alcohol phosphatidyltransferase family protein [Microbacterium sp. AB]
MTTGLTGPAHAVRPSFRALLAELARAQKSGAGVPAYTRWVNRRLARGVAAAAAARGVGPNAVTLASAALSVAGLVALVVAPVSAVTGIVAAALLAAGYVFDSADGQVARLTRRSGPAGEWLDHVVDAVRTPLVHVGVAVAVFVHGAGDGGRPEVAGPIGGPGLMGVALAYAVLSGGQFMSQILAEQLSARHGRAVSEPSGALKSLTLLPTDPGVLCWTFALWGAPAVFGVAYTALFAANLLHTAVSMRRKHRRLSGAAPSTASIPTT